MTPANSSSISDGGAALVLMKRSEAEKRGLTPRAIIHAHATHANEPAWFTTAPIGSIEKVLGKAGWDKDDVDLFEINEAFAVQVLGCVQQLGLSVDDPRLNANGGAIAIGHPLGASGARLALTALRQLEATGGRYALVTMCIGVGQGIATIIERLDS